MFVSKDSLVSSGSLTQDEAESIMKNQREMEAALSKKMSAQKERQLMQIRSRMEQRRKKKMNALRDTQEKEKAEVYL